MLESHQLRENEKLSVEDSPSERENLIRELSASIFCKVTKLLEIESPTSRSFEVTVRSDAASNCNFNRAMSFGPSIFGKTMC